MLSIWLDLEIIGRSVFNQIQAQVDSVIVPPGIGRIPLKILSGFSGFKANQFKNWVNIYSIPCLFAVLEADHLECWRHFILGCRILCKQKLTADEIKLADALLLQFCRRVERMYGQGVITPNMHLHCHLKYVILDFGPSYEFWLFPFERYNGILGSYPTNNKNIEPQIMHRFLCDLSSSSFTFPSEFAENFRDICESLDITKQSGSVVDTQIGSNPSDFIIPRHSVYATFDKTDLSNLKILCCKLFNHTNSESLVVNTVYLKYSSVTITQKLYNSSDRSSSPFVALATNYDTNIFGASLSTFRDSNCRPVKIHHYAKISYRIDTSVSYLVVAVASWYYPHPDYSKVGKPVQVWCDSMFESVGIHTFIPLNFLVNWSMCSHC